MDLSWRPPHAYVPGQTPRHDEALFDAVRQVSDPLQACLAWQLGLALLRDGYYWEAHEMWEAVWMAAPPNSREKALVQGLIQLANAALKQRMRRPRATARLDAMARTLVHSAMVEDRAILGMTQDDVQSLWYEVLGEKLQ